MLGPSKPPSRPPGRPGASAIALAACLAFAALPAAGAEDVPVPFHAGGKIQRIDSRLASQLGLFHDAYPGFQEARLYRLPDSTFSLEIARVVDGREVRERIALPPAAADSLLGLVAERLERRLPAARRDQRARPLLLAGSAVMGFGFYGWALPMSLQLSGSDFAGAYLLTTAGSILLPAFATRNRDVTYPMVALGLYGASRGIVHGVVLADALAKDADSETIAGTALVVSLAEGVAGAAWGGSLTEGEAGTIATGGDLGLMYGLGVVELAGARGRRRDAQTATAVLVGSGAGVAAGRVLGRARDYSYGDTRIMRTAGWLGAYAGLAITGQNEDASTDATVVAAMTGAAAGLAVGDRLVAGAGYTFAQSVYVDFMTVAGALMTWGVALLAEPAGGYGSDGAYLAATAAGAIAGYGFTLALQPKGGRPARASALRLGIAPRWAEGGRRGEMVPQVVVTASLP